VHPVRLDAIALRIDLHLRHRIVILHILLADPAAALNRLDTFLKIIRLNRSRG
jgi:hypothetical protein